MIENNPQPLAIARRVLAGQTLSVVGRAPFTRRGWAILDRWALNSPAALQALEAQGLPALQARLLLQQEQEAAAVLAYADQADAVPELELLQLAGIDTELTAAPARGFDLSQFDGFDGPDQEAVAITPEIERRMREDLAKRPDLLIAQQRQDAEDVAAGRRTARSLWAVQPGDMSGYTFTPSPTSEYDKPGEGW